jgi:hypothetical protein
VAPKGDQLLTDGANCEVLDAPTAWPTLLARADEVLE